MRIRFEQSFEAQSIETILNVDMSVAYITDCATSPVKLSLIFCPCSAPVNLDKTWDQTVLRRWIWPLIRDVQKFG
jgi:hypothetical protein